MAKNTLQDIKQQFIDCAAGLGDYDSISKTDLANGYCDADEAGDELKRSQYYSALMLRYWHKIYEYAKSCASMRLELEDFVGWMDDSFYWAFRYRRWRDPNNPLHDDPNGPDKVFNQCFFSTRGRYYQHSNKEVRRANWTSTSLDALEESVGDHSTVLETSDPTNPEKELIQKLLGKSKVMDALVIDGILHQDVFDDIETRETMQVGTYDEDSEEYQYHNESYTKHTYQFNLKKLVKHIKHLDRDFTDYFTRFYDLDEQMTQELEDKVSSLSPSRVNTIVQRTLYRLSEDEEVRNLLGDPNVRRPAQ